MGTDKIHLLQHELKNIPIVYSLNSGFMPFLGVKINSVLAHANPNCFYDVVILHSDISSEEQESFIKEYSRDNLSIRFYSVEPFVKNIHFYTSNRPDFTAESYYRLFIPEIFSEEYDKVIYLDSDMICLADIAELVDIPLGDNVFGGVRDYSGIGKAMNPAHARFKLYRESVVGMKDQNLYIIAGLIIFNLPECRKLLTLTNVYNILKEREWEQHDQDIVNHIANGRTTIIDAKWNVLTDFGNNKNLRRDIYAEWKNSFKEPSIYHFGGHIKPWYQDCEHDEEFWTFALQSSAASQIIERLAVSICEEDVKTEDLKKAVNKVVEELKDNKLQKNYTSVFKKLRELTLVKNNNETPLISVIVPVYNAAATLHTCLKSIVDQTYSNLEIIVIDDGSTDGSGAIIDSFAKEDSRFKVVHKENGGVSSARNLGLSMVTGEYIGWVDADDFIDLDYYEYLIDSIKEYKVPLAISGAIGITGNKYYLIGYNGEDIILNARQAIAKLLDYSLRVYLHDRLFEARLFDGIQFTDNRLFEDTEIMHGIFEKARWMVLLKDHKYHHTILENSLSHEFTVSNKAHRLLSVIARKQFIWDKYIDLRRAASFDVYNAALELRDVVLASSKEDYKNNENDVKTGLNELKTVREYVCQPLLIGKAQVQEFDIMSKGTYSAIKHSLRPIKLKAIKDKTLWNTKMFFKNMPSALARFPKAVLRTFFPAYHVAIRADERARIAFETIIANQAKPIVTKLEKNNSTLEYLEVMKFAKPGETYFDAKKRLFMAMPKWGGQVSCIQEATLKLLLNFDKICKKHNLPYCLIGGTLLGAYRHGGYIPWDDDVDLGMMRNDLEKLKLIVSKEYPDFSVTKFFYSKRAWQTYKFTFKDDSLPFFVDIMCYDYAGSENDDPVALWKSITSVRNNSIKALLKANMVNSYGDEPVNLKLDLNTIIKNNNTYLAKLPPVSQRKYIYRSVDCFASEAQSLYPIEKILPLKTIKFEGYEFPAPNDIDWLLERRYGDIYTLPGDIGHRHSRIIETKGYGVNDLIDISDLKVLK